MVVRRGRIAAAQSRPTPNRSIIQLAMLWIEMKAAVETSPSASCSKTIERVQPAERRAADVLLHIEPGEPQLGGLLQHVDREVPLRVPARGVRRQLGGGEGAGRVLDRPLVF